MPWFKVDDHFPTHHKVLSIPRGPRRLAALGAWTLGGAWTSANLKEGLVPEGVVEELAITTKAVADLVASGLWVRVPGGYQMHDFLNYNPTAEQVLKDRADAAERQRRAREKARLARLAAQQEDDPSRRDSHRDSRGSHTGSHGPPDPTRSSSDLREDVDVELPATARFRLAAVEGWPA